MQAYYSKTIEEGKKAIVQNIAEEWNRAEINYAVAHGLEGFPATLGRDLDVLVQNNHIMAAINVARQVIQDHGLTVLYPSSIWGERLIAIRNDRWSEVIEIHTFKRLSWRHAVFADYPIVSQHAGPFKIDPWVSFIKRVLIPILAQDLQRFQTKPEELSFRKGELDVVETHLPSFFGAKVSRAIITGIYTRDLKAIEVVVPKLKRSLILYSLYKAPLTSMSVVISALRRRIIQPFSPCAPIIALVGPDGVGKSTLIKQLKIGDRSVFTKIVTRHWRPEILPLLGTLLGKSGFMPNSEGYYPPRRTPGKFHTIRLIYYFLDYFIGYFLKDRIDSSLQRVVIYDRCALDMTVDPVRYGLSSNRGTMLLWRLIPKPDMVILLSDDPERIYSRKDELTKEEIKNQLKQWRMLLEKGEVNEFVITDAPPEDLIPRIRKLILNIFIEKNRI